MLTTLVYLIAQIAPGIYFLCAAGLLLNLRRLLMARGELARAEFELEREMALEKRASAITWGIASIQLALMAAAIALVVAPTVRADLLARGAGGPAQPAPNLPDVFLTSTPGGDGRAVQDMMATNTAQALAGSGGDLLLLTPLPSPTPVGTIVAGYPTPADCNEAGVRLVVPTTGMVLFDSVTVIGVATIPNFAFYKFELNGPSTGGAWAPFLGEQTSPLAVEGVLGQMPLIGFQPGDYRFRLAVFDNTGTLRASCTVAVNIRERPPTPTPFGSGGP